MHSFYVPDISCKHCVKMITAELNKAGFSDFEIDLNTKKITAKASEEEAGKILSLIEEAGYSPTEATIQ